MKKTTALLLFSALIISLPLSSRGGSRPDADRLPGFTGLFYETTNNRTYLPLDLLTRAQKNGHSEALTADGRTVKVAFKPDGNNFLLRLTAKPDQDIVKWGIALAAAPDEYFTGLMERVVDGPQSNSWATNILTALNLRGQKVAMILKPTLSVYAPYYLSSRGYAVFVQGNWPGFFDFGSDDPQRVKIEFEGSAFEAKFFTADNPAALVRAHALDAGPPLLPPKWMYSPWRWRDENTQRTNYYDGTPVTGPFNSEFMEDILLMKAYGIPCGIYWIDRPWGPGPDGYNDFEIDTKRLPNFAESIKWLNQQNVRMFLWIGPYFQGHMATNALARGWTLASAGQKPFRSNYPLADYTNPKAKKYWQDGVAKLLKLGVVGFKLDRSEENIPERGPYHVYDGRSIRENRNAYPPMYLKAAYDVAKKHRGDDFVCMPRAAYTGSAPYGVFWGGDIGGTAEGLRAEIIAVQRAAVMGYPNWGSDTCGYNRQSMDTEVCGRWLGFSCFTPIMEVGPTRNRAFWNFHNPPAYDAELIAIWRLYARLHERLADYSFAQAKVAHESGLPIVRPLFLVDPAAPAAWSNWWTYLYGPDILVSPIWQKNQRTQEVYLPSGSQWRDAWNPGQVYDGGQTITVNAELHQLPIFVRAGSKVEPGDLNQEWNDAVAAANTRPDLKALDAEVKAWFDQKNPGSATNPAPGFIPNPIPPFHGAKAKPVPSGPVEPTWDSIRANCKVPDWFNEAKFGIFIHWGVYAVPAYHNEWYAKHMYGTYAQWHTEHFGPPDKFGYKDFIPMFKAEKYDPHQWAELFKKSGAKYVVPVAEHHDGFAMYDSRLTRWCAGKMGPKRDLIGDLAKAVREQGLIFGLSSHRMEHHTFMFPTAKVKTDLFDPRHADFYGPPVPGHMNDGAASPAFQDDWLARCQELVDKYQPQLFWFDNGVNDRAYDDVKLKFAAYYFNRAAKWGKQVSLSTKDSAFLAGSILDFEKALRAPKDILPENWQVDDQIAGNSWGYVNPMNYRSTGSIIYELADVASKNGNLLLNISPRADGTIPDEQQKILLDIGKWLGVNGEAIYGSHAWTAFGEGGNHGFRFTTKGDALYAVALSWPENETVITSLATTNAASGQITGVTMLGHNGALEFSQDENGLKIKMPAEKPCAFAWVFKITGLKLRQNQ